MKHYWAGSLCLAVTLLSGGCGADADHHPDADFEVSAVPDTVVTTDSGLIGGLVDWAVGSDGSLFLLDFRARRVHVTDSTGRSLRTIGRPGQGPGELERPATVYLSGESLIVVDPGTGRLEEFTLDGEATASRSIPPCATGPAPPALGPNGIFVRPTLGFDTGLAVVCSPSGEERARLGELPAPGQAVVDMGQMRAQILEGEVPAMFLNAADAVVGADGAVWLLLSAAARIEKYDPQGQRVFQITLDDPEFDAVHAAWIERNEEMDGPGVASLRYILSARDVGGELWALTSSTGQSGARLVVLSNEGDVTERLHFAHVRGAGDFIVDEARGWVYFYISDGAEVIRVSLDQRETE